MKLTVSLFPVALGGLLLAGCGGSIVGNTGGGGGGGGSTTTIPFATPSADYSGATSAFVTSSADWSVTGSTIAASLTGGSSTRSRTLSLNATTAAAIAAGTEIDASGGALKYTEATRAGGDEWVSTSGTITVRNLTETDLTIQFGDVTMTAAPNSSAVGSFRVNGTYVVKRVRVVVGNGAADVTFAGDGNVSRAPLKISHGGTNIVTLTGINAGGSLLAGRATAAGTMTRDFFFTILVPDGAPLTIGQRFDLSLNATTASVGFTEMVVNLSDPQNPVTKTFSSNEDLGGLIEVVGLTADGVAFRFVDVPLQGINEAPSSATGRLTVNGTFTAKFSQE